MPKPPQLSPLDVEEQRLYSELLPGDRASHPIPKGSPSHPAEKAHFGCLYPGFCHFGHDPKLMNIDINECKTGVCPKGDCVNTLGSYYCQCIPGMRYDANGSCVDIDECKADSQICWDYSTCINTNGSYSCHCLPGFKINRIGLCVDINECVEEKRYCGNEGLCHNLIGSYWCQCSPGSTNYGQNGTKCVELSCDPQEARPGKTLPGLGDLMSLVREKCLSLRNSSTSGPSGPPLGGDVLLKVRYHFFTPSLQ
uniref:EGF-like domain-containing protein n=1 Tax=Esox lucius TaxID=8010 RepID=A0AAY5JYN9_ESOLU